MRLEMFGRLACGLVFLGSFAVSCMPADSDSEDNDGSGGRTAVTTGSGGTPATGSGGSTPAGTGGAAVTGSGGRSGTGGAAVAGSGGRSGGTGGAGAGGNGGYMGGGAGRGGGRAGAGSGGRSGSGGVAAGGAMGSGGNTGAAGSPGAGGAAVMTAGCGSANAPKSNTYTISVNGTNRTYILKVPDNYDANKPYRLILAYHWLNGTAQNVASGNYYGLWSLSSGSTIFVAPQGIGNAWRDSGRTSTQGGEDIQFTKALVDDLSSKLCIDKTRIFAEGFSMGGSMSYAVACAMGDVVRAVVAHSGGPMSGCVQHSKPVAYFMTHGTQDSVCTYPGYGVPQINDFAKVNGCGMQNMPTPSGTAPACVDFPNCMPGYPARACIFVGDHTASPPGNWVPTETWKFISQF